MFYSVLRATTGSFFAATLEGMRPAIIVRTTLIMTSIVPPTTGSFDTPAIPAIFSMLMIALSFKIAEGFAFGIVAYVLAVLAAGRAREIKTPTWVLFAAMCAFLAYS